jgi:predicted TIM-barrel fold metal-dependent hydrolase
MEVNIIIDSHSHWGPSITLGTNVTTNELSRQQKEAGIDYVAIIPFPSTAIDDNSINVALLEETKKIKHFIPYHYIREDFDRENFDPIPDGYCGGKWHWMRGVQDAASNYRVLEDKAISGLIEKLTKIGKPIIFEEELSFTERFVEMAPELKLIIPHLGLLGGNPYDFLNAFKNKKNIYFDTALGDRSTIFEFVRTIGPERVLFGSDVPFGTMKSELSKVSTLQIPREEKEFLLYKNFLRLTNYKIESK